MEISVLLFLRNLGAMKEQMRTIYQTSIIIILFTEQETKKKGGSFCIYIHKQLEFNLRNDVDIFNNKIETCSVEISNGKSKTFVVTGVCRPPKGDIKVFKNYSKDFLKKEKCKQENSFYDRRS